MLRKWQKDKKEELLSSEEAKQEIAVSKVRGFLDAVGKSKTIRRGVYLIFNFCAAI